MHFWLAVDGEEEGRRCWEKRQSGSFSNVSPILICIPFDLKITRNHHCHHYHHHHLRWCVESLSSPLLTVYSPFKYSQIEKEEEEESKKYIINIDEDYTKSIIKPSCSNTHTHTVQPTHHHHQQQQQKRESEKKQKKQKCFFFCLVVIWFIFGCVLCSLRVFVWIFETWVNI